MSYGVKKLRRLESRSTGRSQGVGVKESRSRSQGVKESESRREVN